MEDLDTPRVVPGAADHILDMLDILGFAWDGPVAYQSERTALYDAALCSLHNGHLVFECSCSRSELSETAYPGTCRQGPTRSGLATALRFRVSDSSVPSAAHTPARLSGPEDPAADRVSASTVCFDDLLQGRVCIDVAVQSGDFVIRRRDGIWAYQLAVVVDDCDQGITEVVRGCDLLDSTPRQILLQRALRCPTLRYAHLPLVVDTSGRKLSKSENDAPLTPSAAGPTLWQALQALGQRPPPELRHDSVTRLWDWAFGHWTLSPLQNITRIPMPGEVSSFHSGPCSGATGRRPVRG